MNSGDLLTSPRAKWFVFSALALVAVLMIVASQLSSATPSLAAVRAIRHAVGPATGAIRVSGRYRFEEVDGSSSPYIQLVCGTVTPNDRPRRFGVLVGRLGNVYAADELVIEPPRGRTLLAREAQLLNACAG